MQYFRMLLAPFIRCRLLYKALQSLLAEETALAEWVNAAAVENACEICFTLPFYFH